MLKGLRQARADHRSRLGGCWALGLATVLATALVARADHVKELQAKAMTEGQAAWGHWGAFRSRYSAWATHSNRLIPLYSFGMNLASVAGEKSPYRSSQRLVELYGREPLETLNEFADYFDQADVCKLQRQAFESGKRRIILIVFDGMDWQTTWAAACYRAGGVPYRDGRGSGLHIQDYRGTETDFGYFVSSPHNDGTDVDPSAQTVVNPGGKTAGGYDWRRAGTTPWATPTDPLYPITLSLGHRQAYTDSAASATSLTCGIKTYNDAINVDYLGRQVEPIARQLQASGLAVGVVTSVPISHATPACAYANNVSRDDYQDLTRDLVGLASVAHRDPPLPGVDVLIGAGWHADELSDPHQGSNFIAGNRYLTEEDQARIDARHGGRYQVVERTAHQAGAVLLAEAAKEAAEHGRRLFGYFGVAGGHLPFRTADGQYDPTRGLKSPAESYSESDRAENPTLAEMALAALQVLERDPDGFWLMIEAGDVDWANHDNNIDNSIGAVISGDEMFHAVTDWIEGHGGWDQTVVLVTADHGHYLVLEQPEALGGK